MRRMFVMMFHGEFLLEGFLTFWFSREPEGGVHFLGGVDSDFLMEGVFRRGQFAPIF